MSPRLLIALPIGIALGVLIGAGTHPLALAYAASGLSGLGIYTLVSWLFDELRRQ